MTTCYNGIIAEKIEDGYVIHHKDGNPTNDTIENLELMDRAQHAYIHSGTLRQYWDNLKEQNLDRQSNNTEK